MEKKKRINPKLVKQLKLLLQKNRKYIESGKKFFPVCIIIHKSGKGEFIPIHFRDGSEKQIFRSVLLKHIVNSKVLGYFLVLDVKMTTFDPTRKKPTKVVDAIMTSLHTPNGSRMHCLQYEGKKILEDINLSKESDSIKSEWDIWGESIDETDPENQKANREYEAYKKAHPELFKEVA